MTDDDLIKELPDIANGLTSERRKRIEGLVLTYQHHRVADLTMLSPGRRVDYE